MYALEKSDLHDDVQAYKWYSIAVANGDEDANDNRGLVEKKMTPAQIAEAEKLAREWMEKQK